MRCRYCNIALATSRSFVDGEFCCDDHRQRFELDHPAEMESRFESGERFEPEETFEPEAVSGTSVTSNFTHAISAALQMLRRRFERRAAVADDAEMAGEIEFAPGTEISEVAPELSSMPAEPAFEAEAVSTASAPLESPSSDPARETAGSWRWMHAAWKSAPRDLKLVSLLLPVLLVVAVTGSVPTVPIRQLAPQNLDQMQGQLQKVVEDHWKNLNQTISDRAAVSYADDFRSGLDAWESRSNLTRSWSYDASGFVRPGPLAVFKPTVDLTDYRFEFLAEIDQKALGWAFRAEDLNNYYAMKFVVVKPGPLPLVHIVRYAVINGKEGPHVDKPLPMTVRTDMLYRIQVNTRGGDFTILAQGQVVDFWSDNRLQHGGVGFFCNRGERARLRWVEVSHQYDALGRLCAYLAPYGIEGRNGNIN
jgi:hypothetical protein